MTSTYRAVIRGIPTRDSAQAVVARVWAPGVTATVETDPGPDETSETLDQAVRRESGAIEFEPVERPVAADAAIVQGRWDHWAQVFADAVADTCPHDPPHEAKGERGLWLDLDDCAECDEGDPNYAYGALHALSEVATDLGVVVEQRFPELTKEES